MSGGLLDQPAQLMDYLDVVENEVERFRQQRAEEQEGERMKTEMAKNLGKR